MTYFDDERQPKSEGISSEDLKISLTTLLKPISTNKTQAELTDAINLATTQLSALGSKPAEFTITGGAVGGDMSGATDSIIINVSQVPDETSDLLFDTRIFTSREMGGKVFKPNLVVTAKEASGLRLRRPAFGQSLTGRELNPDFELFLGVDYSDGTNSNLHAEPICRIQHNSDTNKMAIVIRKEIKDPSQSIDLEEDIIVDIEFEGGSGNIKFLGYSGSRKHGQNTSRISSEPQNGTQEQMDTTDANLLILQRVQQTLNCIREIFLKVGLGNVSL